MPEAQTLISVEEYLSTVYKPDCDYIDGEVYERSFGDVDHGLLHTAVAAYFHARRDQWKITVLMSIRIQVRPTCIRVPDIAVVLGRPKEQILTKPPFLCVEILSPEDRWSRVMARVRDLLDLGVPFVWIVNPETRSAYIDTPAEGLREVKDGVLRTQNPTFEVPLSEFFS
jgi:Uma2 family endonuclease